MLVGIDAVDNQRFARALERHPGIVERLFTPQERRYCWSRPNPVQHFAARFAAKEAVGKALGTGVTSWQEIEISSGGQPRVQLSGAIQAVAQQRQAGPLQLSMSHSGLVSLSVAVALEAGDFPIQSAIFQGER